VLRAARRELGGLSEVSPCATSLHLVGWLPQGRDDRQVSEAAARAGPEAPPLSGCYVEGRARGGLLLAHANFDARQIRDAVRRPGAALRGGDSPPERLGRNALH
jgi:GntR family transcriptional regulator / MocR family aminotransferase